MLSSHSTRNCLLISIILQFALFFIPVFPSTLKLPVQATVTFAGIYLYLIVVTFILLKINTSKNAGIAGWRRHALSFAVMLASYMIYMLVMFDYVFSDTWEFLSQETANFLSTWIISMLIGYSYLAISNRNEKEHELERLKLENLQSKCEALTNQINPHFFFNMLNGLSALIRSNNRSMSLEYIDEMSDVFRYVIQVNSEMLIPLNEELKFLDSYRYLLEIRYKDKLSFDFDIDSKHMHYRLPTLSLLTVVENVVKHNTIDSDHKMTVSINISDEGYLVITNPIYEKLSPAASNRIGLANLSTRFRLLMDKDMKVRVENNFFSILLPLHTA